MIKKVLFLVCLFIGLAQLSQAQKTIKGLVGVNFSNLSENKAETEVTGNAGFQVGGAIRFGEKFYVEPGFQFVSNSRNFTYQIDGENEFKVTENWYKIPVYAGLHLLGDRDEDLAIRVFLGPSVAFLGNVNSDEDDLFKKDDIESTRWALDGGVGVDILFLFAELNYEYSLTEYGEDFDASHGAFIINVGVHFNL